MLLLLYRLDQRAATIIRLIGFGLISWTVFNDPHHPGTAAGDWSSRSRYVICVVSLAGVDLAPDRATPERRWTTT